MSVLSGEMIKNRKYLMSSSVLHLTQDGLFIIGDSDQYLGTNKYQEQNIEKTRQELHV